MKNLIIDISGDCNIKCEFCYQKLDGSRLSKEDIFKIIDINQRFDTIEIGGGEPLLYNGIEGVIKQIKERGKKAHISTNATIIPEEFLGLEAMLKKILEVQISLHASNSQLYKKITKKDLFDRVIKNIEKIKAVYPTSISSAIYQANFSDVPNIVNLAYGLDLPIRINLVFPAGSGKNVDLITSKQIDELKSYLILEKIKKRDMIDSPLIHKNNCIALQKMYGIKKQGICPIELGKVYISPRNEKSDCEFLEVSACR